MIITIYNPCPHSISSIYKNSYTHFQYKHYILRFRFFHFSFFAYYNDQKEEKKNHWNKIPVKIPSFLLLKHCDWMWLNSSLEEEFRIIHRKAEVGDVLSRALRVQKSQ